MTTFNEADRRKILESLTADELATFQEAFTVFDKNQDGTITTKVSTQQTCIFCVAIGDDRLKIYIGHQGRKGWRDDDTMMTTER